MERKITPKLMEWKSQPSKKPLVVFGARQTGKTTSVLDFAAAYRQVVHIDFYKQPHLKAAFKGSLEPASIVSTLGALLNRDIDATDTLLFFDEVQDCDEAITSLKFFCTDAPEYDVVAAGSLLGVHVARKGSFPVGYVDMLTMHPMDFEEFCWALDETRSFSLVKEAFAALEYCPVHDRMIELYRSYLLVGGMPEAVLTYALSKSFEKVRKVQRDVRTAYVADMAKYVDGTDAAKIVSCWESLPAQLAKESGSTKFMWKYVASGAKAERYASAVDWLVAAGVVDRCTQVTDGASPLKSFESPSSFKLYVADTGLLANAFGAAPADFDDTGHRSARFRGGIAENYVMQQLVAGGVQVYYWGMQSTHEVEFVIKSRDGVIPVEVKSGSHVRAASANRFVEKYGSPYAVRVTGKNFGADRSIRSIPLYAACLLAQWCE